ncbi:hypothetical protein BZG36_04715 [Bifiguratus adelaidae]|uniref:Mitotic-spindle organizing protein 1 n=1 Tax=Bifiguratus adelaidae TaxID=1938954 RepID=A0A261XVF0_9FUNG|nr:hypothetical protein BZG36_04715 [Bifiguratus adelaidae]
MESTTLQSARDTMEVLYEMSNLLNTGLDKESLSLCVSLIEQGVNPEALANVIKEVRRETAALKSGEQPSATMERR